MIDRDMVMVCVMAQLQAEGKEIKDIFGVKLDAMIDEAIADLELADSLVTREKQ